MTGAVMEICSASSVITGAVIAICWLCLLAGFPNTPMYSASSRNEELSDASPLACLVSAATPARQIDECQSGLLRVTMGTLKKLNSVADAASWIKCNYQEIVRKYGQKW